MDKHDFISNIERKENVYFSQVVLPLMDAQLSIFDKLKKHVEENKTAWQMPTWPAKCESCGAESTIYIELDNTSFFDNA